MKRNFLLLILLLSFFSFLTPLQAQDFKTVGYLPYYRFSLIDDIAFEKLTHLNIAFANPDSQGDLSVGNQDIDPIVTLGHEHGLEVYISLAGGLTSDWVTNWMNLLQPENRTAYIHKIVNFTLAHNLEGVDVDLEWSNVTSNYSGFVLELKDSLTAHQLGMTAALPGTYRYPNISEAALDAYDWINMMIYDFTGPWAPDNPGQHSSYQFAQNAVNYWTNQQGVSPDRLTLGVPFYGYDFSDPGNVHSFTFNTIVGQDPAYADQDQVGLSFYNGRPTIGDKTELALESVSGIMIWELGQDALGVNEEFSLLNVIHQIIFDHFVGTTEIAAPFAPNVYPNPFQNTIHVEALNGEEIVIQLATIEGKVILKERINEDEALINLPTAYLNKGFYVLSITDGKNISTHKLVKY